MATIQQFIAVANNYVAGARDERIKMREVRPDAIETEQGDIYYIEPLQQSVFAGTAPQFTFNKWSFRQYCKRIEPQEEPMPPGYIHACGKTLGLAQLRYWNEVNRDREAFLRLTVDPKTNATKVRAVLSGHYTPIDAHLVGQHFEDLIDPDQDLDFLIDDEYWQIVFWEKLQASKSYGVGFRILGSEIGAITTLRLDVLLSFTMGPISVTLPVLIRQQPLCTIAYTAHGAETLNRLDQALNRGLQAADECQEAVERRKLQSLDYPADEFYELAKVRNLPASIKAMPVEAPDRFQGLKTKFDLVCKLAEFAGEMKPGRSRLRVEAAAALYLLTGRVRTTRNRNDPDYDPNADDDYSNNVAGGVLGVDEDADDDA